MIITPYVVTENNSYIAGSAFGGTTIVAMIFGAIIGFTTMDIFTRLLVRKVIGYLQVFADTNNMPLMRRFFLQTVLRLSLRNITTRDHMEKTVKIATSFGMESSAFYIMLSSSYIAESNISQAQYYLQKALSCRPSPLQVFTILQRSHDLDALLGDKKLITRLIDSGEATKIEMLKYTRLFFKELVAVDIDMNAADNFAGLAATYELECDRIYNDLINRFPKNANVNRVYGRYIEDVKNDAERAQEYYMEADAIEEGDNERLKLRQKTTMEVNEDFAQDEPKEEEISLPLGKRTSLSRNSVLPMRSSPRDKYLTNSSRKPIEKQSEETASSAATSDKAKTKLANHLNAKQSRKLLRLGIYAIAPVLCVVVIVIGAVLQSQLPYVSTDILLNSCGLQPVSFQRKLHLICHCDHIIVINAWRQFGRNHVANTNISDIIAQLQDVRDRSTVIFAHTIMTNITVF
jgi:hypothetical protein